MTTLRRWLRDGRWLWAVGGGFAGWHAAHLAVRPGILDTPLTAVFTIIGPALASLTVVAVGLVLGTRFGTGSLRVVGRWTVAGSVASAGLGALTVLYFRTNGVAPPSSWYLLSNSATGGALGGALVGVYDARAVRIAGRLRDERRRVERLNQRLRVLNRVLRHDLRNDANVVEGYASLLAAHSDPEVSERGEIIRGKAAELAALGDRARDLERLLDDGTVGAESDLAAVVARRLDAFEREHPEARIRRDVPARAPVAPAPLLGVVVDALVENAVVHNDADRPRVSVRVRASEDRVSLRVADDGPGIPESERRVFDAGTETPLRHSNGLGLWVVNWAAAEAGGEVDIRERDEERGSVVSVTLPREAPTAAADGAGRAAPLAAANRIAPLLQSLRGESE